MDRCFELQGLIGNPVIVDSGLRCCQKQTKNLSSVSRHPSTQELNHDFHCQSDCCLPEWERIGIFNRSCYEELMIVAMENH